MRQSGHVEGWRPVERIPLFPSTSPGHIKGVTDLLDKAAATLRSLPPGKQDEIARVVLAFIGGDLSIYQLAPEEAAGLDAPKSEAKTVLSRIKRDVGGL